MDWFLYDNGLRYERVKKKEILAQVFSRGFCEIFKNIFFLSNTSGG